MFSFNPSCIVSTFRFFSKLFIYVISFVKSATFLNQGTSGILLSYLQHFHFFLSKTIPKYGLSRLDI